MSIHELCSNKTCSASPIIKPLSCSQRALQLCKCACLILSTLGLVLLSHSWRNSLICWFEEFLTGERKVIKLVANTKSAKQGKKNQAGENLIKKRLLHPLDIRAFLNKARKDITSCTINELERGYRKILKEASKDYLQSSDDKTTFFKISEKLSNHFIHSNFSKAQKIRIAAIPFGPSDLFERLGIDLAKVDSLIGLKLQPLGTDALKNHTLTVRKLKLVEEKRSYLIFTEKSHYSSIRVDLKLRKRARAELANTIKNIEEQNDIFFRTLPFGFCKKVTVSEDAVLYRGRKRNKKNEWGQKYSNSKGYSPSKIPFIKTKNSVIYFEGIGQVKIGLDKEMIAEYNHLSIELDSRIQDNAAVKTLHIIFTALGLGTITSAARVEDNERIKVMQVFRAYYPAQSSSLIFKETQSSIAFFEGSVESLKEKIIVHYPKMKEFFAYFFDPEYPNRIYKQEIHPGNYVWCIKGLAELARKQGAIGLMAGARGMKNLISILKLGAMSTQDRFTSGMIVTGASSNADLETGGAESVFTRLITANMLNISFFPIQGDFKILYDLELVERVGHCYSYDLFGTKDPYSYHNPAKRFSIFHLAALISKADPNSYKSNEVCLPECISPKFIKRILVSSFSDKKNLIAAMKTNNLLQNNNCFNSIPVDQFIKVGALKEEYWKS